MDDLDPGVVIASSQSHGLDLTVQPIQVNVETGSCALDHQEGSRLKSSAIEGCAKADALFPAQPNELVVMP